MHDLKRIQTPKEWHYSNPFGAVRLEEDRYTMSFKFYLSKAITSPTSGLYPYKSPLRESGRRPQA